MVVGLAVSNEGVPNAAFEASHILSACEYVTTTSSKDLKLTRPLGGSYLSDPRDRDAAVEFLVNAERRIGWRTEHIVAHLRAQWQE